MRKLVRAISEETFESWEKEKQNQWIKDHPNSKFKNLDEIKNLREEIKDKTSFRPSDYADNWGQGNREREAEDKRLSELDERLKRLERKPLHKVRFTKPKEVSPLNKYKLPQSEEPHFSESLEPFNNFSKRTGIRNIDDLKQFAENLSKDYGNYEARQSYKKLADSLLNKYKGTVVHSGDLDPSEKKMIHMLALYKKEKEFYEENERRKQSPEYKKFLEMRDNYERENNRLKPLMREWYNAKGEEVRIRDNPNISQEEKDKVSRRRAQLGKELHNRRLNVDKLIQETNEYEKQNRDSKFPDMFPVSEPIFGKQSIEFEKLGMKKMDI